MQRLIFLVLCIFLATPAHADFTVCNGTDSRKSIAVIERDEGEDYTGGWYTLEPGKCEVLVKDRMRNYWIHSRAISKVKDARERTACVSRKRFQYPLDHTCDGQDDREVTFFQIRAKDGNASFYITADGQRSSGAGKSRPQSAFNTEKACSVLYQELQRPQLRSTPIVLGRYTDPFTPPQSRTECTNVYDTGVPDPKTCSTEWDDCASKWHGPFGSWGCVPGTTTRCSNIKMCNTWKTDIRTMECDLQFQIKLPNYVEKPLSEFIDRNYKLLEEGRRNLAGALPLECVPKQFRNQGGGQSTAEAIRAQIENEIKNRVRKEGERWLQETAITVIISSIPSGGVGGAATLTGQVATFVYRVYTAVKPILDFVEDAKDLAENVGFSTSCGWSDWHPL